MNRSVLVLAVLVVIQLLIAATLYWPEGSVDNGSAREQLLSFNPDSIDEIYVEDDAGNEAILLRMEGRWILPDLGGIVIDGAMIQKLITALADSANEWPVATTAASRQRFQVAGYHFQRRLTLIAQGELRGTIYLGTSPGFRKVHARNDAQDAIYTISFNNYDAPAIDDGWLDKTLLQIIEPQRISGGDFALMREGESWVTDVAQNMVDQRELAALLLGLSSLQVEGVAAEDTQRTLSIAVPELSMEIITIAGPQTLALFTLGDRHFVKSSRFDYFFTLSAYDFDRLANVDTALLAGKR